MDTGSNMAVTVFHNVLSMLRQNLDDNKTIPQKLYLQVDGGSENWNRTMFSYLARINRMPPGHSHSDIDGRWGNLSTWLHGTKKMVVKMCTQ